MNSIKLETTVQKDIEDDVKTFDSMSPRPCKEENNKKYFIISLVVNMITSIIVTFSSVQVLHILDQGMDKLDNINKNVHDSINSSVHILQKIIETEIANITLSY